ncbi:peptidase, partial [Halorubrum persicum]
MFLEDTSMAALQTTPPSISAAVAAFVGLALIGGLIGIVGTVVVRRLRNPVGKYRLLYGVVLFPYVLLSYAVLALTGSGAAFLTALPASPELLDEVLSQFATFLAAGCIWLVSYLPTVRGVRDVRDVELATGPAISKMARYVVGLSAVLTVVLTPLQVFSLASSPLVFVLALVILILGVLYASPWLIPVLRSTSTPIGERADRVEQLCSQAGFNVRDIRILETENEETASTVVRGPPNYRRLFVTSTFLDVFDDALFCRR